MAANVKDVYLIGSLEDFPVGIPRGVELEGRRICVVRTDPDRMYAIGDVCTHEEGLLSDGLVMDMAVECPMHGSQFDLETGEALCPPADGAVPTYAVHIDGDAVYVKLTDRAA